MNKPHEEDDFNEAAMFTPAAIAPPTNPLAAYFRMPGLHIQLPTRGAFLPPETYDPTLAGDIPVFPMKASDELLLRSADALMSGYAIENMILSCVPAIRNPRMVSSPDLDVILLAIRAATYGPSMEIEVNCPECGTENAFDCDLAAMISTMTFIDPVNEVRLSDDLLVTVKPYTLATATKIALASYDEARKLQSIEEDDPLRADTLNQSYMKMNQLNLGAITDAIISVTAPTGTVTDKRFIFEFLSNTNQGYVKKIDKKLAEINSKGIDKHVDAECRNCHTKWSPEVEFDPTSFFGQSS